MQPQIPSHLLPVFKRLQDDESKSIFSRMLGFSQGAESSCSGISLSQAVTLPDGSKLSPISQLIEDGSARQIVLYGAGICGIWAHHFLTVYHKLTVKYFCDSSASLYGSDLNGLAILSPEQLSGACESYSIVVTVTSRIAQSEIYKRLISLGFSPEQIYAIQPAQIFYLPGAVYPPYFGLPFLRPQEDEVYIDVGCYNGDTLGNFIAFCGGKYKKIYAVEPDSVNFNKLIEYVRENNISDIELIPKGIWSSETALKFNNSGGFSSRITGHGEFEIPAVTIDKLADGEAATLIKIDIEGSELEALQGASATIKKFKPRLAISVYHRPADIEILPEFIHSLNPDYNFYLRHHTNSFIDTVLYAV